MLGVVAASFGVRCALDAAKTAAWSRWVERLGEWSELDGGARTGAMNSGNTSAPWSPQPAGWWTANTPRRDPWPSGQRPKAFMSRGCPGRHLVTRHAAQAMTNRGCGRVSLHGDRLHRVTRAAAPAEPVGSSLAQRGWVDGLGWTWAPGRPWRLQRAGPAIPSQALHLRCRRRGADGSPWGR